jgi:hypothetical protein
MADLAARRQVTPHSPKSEYHLRRILSPIQPFPLSLDFLPSELPFLHVNAHTGRFIVEQDSICKFAFYSGSNAR